MSFGNPHGLWLLGLVPLLAWLLVWGLRARRRQLERFAAAPLAAQLAAGVNWPKRRWKLALALLATTAALVALAQPRWGFEWREVKHRGVEVFVVLDVSRSMLAEDVRPNRLAQAKFAVHDLLRQLAGDRVGLVAFAGTAFVQCPLTIDREALRLTLAQADPALIPRGGTDIGLALETALKGFGATADGERAIVLITDGEDHDGRALAAAEQAAAAGVRIFVIGIGTTEGELIPLRDAAGGLTFLTDQAGQVVKSRLDDATLRALALKTNGLYVRSAPGDFGMATIYREGIARLQGQEFESRLRRQPLERFQWPLALALVGWLAEMFLTDRRREVAA